MNVAVADYPGAAALRRRRQAHEARGEVFPDAGAAGGGGGGIRRDAGGNNSNNNNNDDENIAPERRSGEAIIRAQDLPLQVEERAALAQRQQQPQQQAQAQRGRQNVNRTFSFRLTRSPLRHLRTSQLYCLASLCVALLAIVTTTAPPMTLLQVLFFDPRAADQKMNRWLTVSQVSGSGGGALTSGDATALAVENIARAAAAAVSGNGDISIVQHQAGAGDNNAAGDDGNAANSNFSPPSSYADLFRPFREYARGVLVDLPASLMQLRLQQQQQQGVEGVEGGEDVKGSGKDHHRGDGSGSKDRDRDKRGEGQNKDETGSSQLLNYDSFFFLPRRYLPSGLKWLVGTNIPSSHDGHAAGSSSSSSANAKNNNNNNNNRRRHKYPKNNKGHEGRAKANNNNKDHPPPNTRVRREKLTPLRVLKSLSHALTNLIDPSIRNPSQDGFTKVVDKVLTSTFRLLAIANLLLAVTYLLHGAVAEWFLGGGSGGGGGGNVGTGAAAVAAAGAGGRAAGAGGRMNLAARPNNRNDGGTGNQAAAAMAAGQGQQPAAPAAAALPNTRLTRSTRERLGGYLLFKLLLISAVVEPDTLDLLILLSWYTLLSFLRSLAHLAGSATSHAAQSGSAPLPGVLRLLVAVLLSDFCAAAVCAALFHGAGWSTVLLLACDCALLAVDVLAHIARHVGQVLEDKHASEVGALEDEQLRLGEEARNSSSENLRLLQGGGSSRGGSSSSRSRENEQEQEQDVGGEPDTSDHPHLPLNTGEEAGTASDANDAPEMVDEVNVSEDISSPASPTQGQLRDRAHRESRRIDRQIELLESRHSRQLSILDTVVFGFELAAYMLTICHFLHIWSLHGVSFGLVDGVLALHLHSAVSAMGRKIAERRNLNRIARDLDSHFADATEIELRKSAQAGDVCSVCLGTMSGLRNVKKVGCGHLYHTHCLREVVERARSIEAAKCPLCRASVLNGAQAVESSSGATTGGNAPQQQDGTQQGQQPEQQPPEQQQPQQQARQGVPAGDQALFSFSTENILPNWIPLPALSFEIVRRPPTNNNAARIEQRAGAAPAAGGNNALQQQQEQRPQQQGEMPFWRRLLILSGAIPMSAEEEAAALEQLVDMFPQYDRADLLRELRLRGSAEAVVEAVLAGVFSGVARGVGAGVGAGIPQQPEENGRQDGNANNLFEEDDNSILDTESANDDQAQGNDDEPESNEN